MTCPYVVVADEGTQHCSLAETEVRRLRDEVDRLQMLVDDCREVVVSHGDDFKELVERTRERDALTVRVQALEAAARDVTTARPGDDRLRALRALRSALGGRGLDVGG